MKGRFHTEKAEKSRRATERRINALRAKRDRILPGGPPSFSSFSVWTLSP